MKLDLPPNWDINDVLDLIREVSEDMHEAQFIAHRRGLTKEQFESLRVTDFYRDHLLRFTEEWEAIKSTPQRIALKAMVGIEKIMPTVVADACTNKEELADRVATLKMLQDLAGLGDKQRGNTEPFTLTVNIGTETKIIAGGKEAGIKEEIQQVPQGAANLPAIQPFTERDGTATQVEQLGERTGVPAILCDDTDRQGEIPNKTEEMGTAPEGTESDGE